MGFKKDPGYEKDYYKNKGNRCQVGGIHRMDMGGGERDRTSVLKIFGSWESLKE